MPQVTFQLDGPDGTSNYVFSLDPVPTSGDYIVIKAQNGLDVLADGFPVSRKLILQQGGGANWVIRMSAPTKYPTPPPPGQDTLSPG